MELKNGDFLRIVNIIRDDVTSEVMIKGWIFQRTRDMNGILGKKMNEICWVLQLDEDDDREPEIQGLETVSVSEVLRRRHIRMTNLPFPKLSFREHRAESEEAIINKGVLVCRYKYICSYTDAKARYRSRWSEKQLNRLRAVECDHSSSEADEDLRHLWRGDTATGGACKRLKPGERLFLQREYSEMKPGARPYGTASSHDEHTTYQVIDLTDEASDIISCPRSHQESNKLSQDLQSNTISSREVSLEIVEFHAQLNTKSKRGTYRSEYESRMVSSYLPNSTDINRRKRSRDTNLGDSYHEKKRPNLGERTDPYKDKQINQVLAHAEEEQKEGENFASTLAGKKYRERSSSSVSIEEIKISENTGTCNEVGKIIDLTNHSPTLKARKSVSAPNPLETKIYSIDQDAEPLRTVFSGLPGNDSSNVERRPDHAAKSQASSKSRMIPYNTFSDSLIDQQRYTFGDCFCGGGGMSRGAIGSGLRVEWGFDCDSAACRTYDLNFFSLDVYCLWADQFLGLSDRDHKVDILHLSPPCQYFSHAHTINGKNDEMNTASLFAISDLLQKAKPRVVTLEQTAGLMGRHSSYCHAVVRMFTDHGFSIRWKALNLADFGLPQLRKRLIMIASW